MLTIKHRFYDQIKPTSEPLVHSLPTKTRSSSIILELTNDELLEKTNKIEEENKYIHRENLLFSRYLLRINTAKIVEIFPDYEDENEIIDEILEHTKSSNAIQRLSMKRSSNNARKGISGWTKVPVKWGEQRFTSYILRLEQERFSIALYEVEQTRLEWERMKSNADTTLYHLEVLYQSIDSDKIAQETLNRELERRVDKYRVNIGEEEFNSPYMHVPGELVVSRINIRISSRISKIGLLRLNSKRLQMRIAEINNKIHSLEELNLKLEKVDIVSVRTKKLDHSETYQKIDQQYRTEKLSEQPLFHRLRGCQTILHEQEINTHDMNKKCELLQNHLQRTIIEIDSVEQEYQLLMKENNFLKNRIADVRKVPSITDYAHIIEQIKILQHGIDIWTKRVTIAENLLVQLKPQKKPPRRLPPLESIGAASHRLIEPSIE